MSIDTYRLEAFFAVAQAKNFSKAAKQLAVTQSALSQRIAKLEEDLNTALFIRASSGAKLTATGEELLRYCQTQRSLETEFLSKLGRNTEDKSLRGIIRIAGYSSVTRSLVMPALQDLMIKQPSLSIELVSREVSELLPMLHSGEVDFIIQNQKVEKHDLESIVLGIEENVLISSKKLTNRKDWYLDHHHDDTTTLRFLQKNAGKKTVMKRSYLDDVYGIIDGVKLGYGLAVVSKHLVENDKTLIIHKNQIAFTNPIVLQFYRQPFYSKLHEAIVQALRQNLPILL